MELFVFFLICALGEHFRQYALAIRFVVGLHSAEKFHPIIKYEHYQISSGARISLPIMGAPRNFRRGGGKKVANRPPHDGKDPP